MNLGARLREALLFWRHNAGQGVLGAFGVVVGIFGLVSASAIGGGVRAELDALSADLGVGLMLLESPEPLDPQLATRLALTLDSEIDAVAGFAEGRAAVGYGRADLPAVRAVATSEPLARAIGLKLIAGRWLSAADSAESFNTVVVSESLAATLTPLGSLVGQELRVGSRWMRVIGIAADDGNGATVYVPAAPEQALTSAAVRFRSNDALQRNASLVSQSAARGLTSPEALDVVMPLDALRDEQRLRVLVSTVLTVLSIVVLALGGMSVTNTMLMSVMTRHAEIGLRRALGATAAEVVVQFVLESAIVCVIGGVLALSLSAAFVGVVGFLVPWPLHVDRETVLGACFAITIVSLAAGGLPAIRAARVPPASVLA
jgi:putative ABC transport system permease protein